jgi:hypothetical protein
VPAWAAAAAASRPAAMKPVRRMLVSPQRLAMRLQRSCADLR